MKSFFKNHHISSGFTLVEMMVIAPIVILAIGSFIAVIVSLTGEVLSTRGSNVLAYNLQDALSRIEEDVKLSSEFLAKNSIPFNATNNPQGYGTPGSVSDFTSVGGISGTSLILSTIVTDGNPLASTSKMVYLANQPNACTSYAEYSKNTTMVANIIYFVDSNGTLWRRTVMPPDYANASIRCGNAPWQQPSCQIGYVNSFCKTNDIKLVDGVGSGGLTINYYPTASSTTPDANALDPNETTRSTALKAIRTVSVSINATDTIAGRDINRAGSVRVTRLDTNATSITNTETLTVPATPIVSGKISNGSSVTFSWPHVTSASSYLLRYKINSGGWVNAPTLGTNDRTYSVLANHQDTVSAEVLAENSAGQSAVAGTATLQIPYWAPLILKDKWTQYGGAYADAEFNRTTAGLVVLKGMIKKTSATAAGEVITTLPPSYRPTGKLMFGIVTNNNASGRIDIDTNGDVILNSGNNTYVSLDSIRFMADNTGFSHLPSYTRTALTYSSGWANAGSGWGTGSYVVDNTGRVVVQGTVTPGTTTQGTVITTLPSAQRAAKYETIPGKSNVTSQFGAGGNGLAAVGNGSGNFTLNSFWFPSAAPVTWTAITLNNGWVSYDGGTTYALPMYSKTATEKMVTLKGMIKNGTSADNTLIGTLPNGYQPEGRLVFAQANSNGFNRIDILPNGEIRMVGTGIGNTYQTLSGITFHTAQ